MTKNVLLSKYRKDAKREQAIKYVKKAYAMCEVGYYDDIDGQKKEVRHIEVDGDTHLWRIQMEPEIEELYSTLDIVKALGIPRERLRDWMNRGFVKPSLPAYGQGTIAIFTFADVLAIKLLDRLIEKGFKRELATEISEQVINYKLGYVLDNIILLSFIRDGKHELEVQYRSGGGIFKLEIDKEGKAKMFSGTTGAFESPIDEEWEDIQIINIVNLFNETEAALEKLG